MPNWVHNSITIQGNKNQTTELANLLGAEYKGLDNGSVNFLNLVAPPEKNWEEYSTTGVPGLSIEDKAGHPVFNWYDWNCENWGTKWNACDPEVFLGDDFLMLSFDTAWSPPGGFIEALTSQIKKQKLSMTYTWEEEQGFGEEWSLDSEGNLELVKDWEIPTSHKDYDNRDNECPCEVWEEEMYDDCPKIEVSA